MKICLFSSGYVRTLFYGFHENIELIKSTLPDCKIDVCYSFFGIKIIHLIGSLILGVLR